MIFMYDRYLSHIALILKIIYSQLKSKIAKNDPKLTY